MKPQNCLELLMYCYKKLKGSDTLVQKQQQTPSYDIYYQFFTQIITFIAQSIDKCYPLYQQEIRSINEKIQDEIIDRYFKQKIQPNTQMVQLKSIVDLFLSIKLKSDHLELMKIRQKNLIHKNYNPKNHPNISWKLSNLKQITEKETAQFNFKQFNLQLYAKREEQQLVVSMKLLSMKSTENVISQANSIITFYYSVEINGIKQRSTFIIDHFVLQKKTAITLKTFNLAEMNKFDNQASATNNKIEFIVYLQYDVIYSSLMNYSSYQIEQIIPSHCLSALTPNDLRCVITSYKGQMAKLNQIEQQRQQQTISILMQNWSSNNNYSEDQLIDLFKDLDTSKDNFQALQRVMNQKKIFQFSPLKKMIDDKIKNISNQTPSHLSHNKPRQNSEDLGNNSPKRNSHVTGPMSLRTSSNVLIQEQNEVVKRQGHNTIQNRSELGNTNYLENTLQSTLSQDLIGFSSAYNQNQFGSNRSKTNRIQESIRQIASPKLPSSSTTRNQDQGYMNINTHQGMTLSLRPQNVQQANTQFDHNFSGIHTPVKEFELKQITSKYLSNHSQTNNHPLSNGKPPLIGGSSSSALQSNLQTEANSQNNYDLKKLLSPSTMDRSSSYSNSANNNQIRFLSPGPIIESNNSKNQLNEYFNTEQHKRPQKNYVVQKREISLNDQTQKFQIKEQQDSFQHIANRTTEDGIKYRIKSPQPIDFSKRQSDIIGQANYSHLRLDTSIHSENNQIDPFTKLKSESDLDLIRSRSPKITPIMNNFKGGSTFAGSAVTSPLTKKFVPNFNSDSKGLDYIQPYRLIDLSSNNEQNRYENSLVAQNSLKERDSSLGVYELKGFSINELESNKNLDSKFASTSTFTNIKINSISEIQSESLNSKRRENSEQPSQASLNNLKVYSTNQLFSKAIQQSQNGQNGQSHQRVSTVQNLLSSSNLDNISQVSNSHIPESSNNILPSHILQERTCRKIQILNQINIKSFALSEEYKYALA